MNSIFVLVTGVILLSGLFVVGLNSSDVFASHDDSKNGNAHAKGCQNSNNEKMKDKNKHCDGDGNGDGNGTSGLPIPTNSCGGDSLTADDIAGISQGDIDNIEAIVARDGGDTNDNRLIDTLDEWNELQRFLPDACLISP